MNPSEKPLCVDLYCGLGGWAEGFLAEGYHVRGYDIEAHDYGTGGYPGELILANVLKLHGSQFADAAVIVGSPPCTEYSYMAMPWERAKQIAKALRGHGEFPEGYTGSRTIEQLNALFDAQFRIQREACEAAGRYIPMVMENVRGAQPWVGRAKAKFGSFMLWGDVRQIGRKIVSRLDWERAMRDPSFTMPYLLARGAQSAVKNAGTVWRENGCNEENRMVPSKVPGISFNGAKGSTSPGFNVTAAQRYREEAARRVDEPAPRAVAIGSDRARTAH